MRYISTLVLCCCVPIPDPPYAAARLGTEDNQHVFLVLRYICPRQFEPARCTSTHRSRAGVRSDGTRTDAGRIQDNGSV